MLNKYKKQLFLILCFLIFGFSVVNYVNASGTNVGAIVKTGQIQFLVYPEHRVPATGNWDTIVRFELRNCINNNILFSYSNIPTDSSGSGTINIPLTDIILPDNYGFAIKGFSHLTKEFNCQIFADNIYEQIDFTSEGDLLAGDTSNVIDDYINSLDLSITSNKMFTNDYKSDLNQDTEVNSLDLSRISYNIFMNGD